MSERTKADVKAMVALVFDAWEDVDAGDDTAAQAKLQRFHEIQGGTKSG
ncbi:MAG TPA: hypothetical protein VFU47_07470 [Armatimonadota bacterium]|nr:hypothetical protein [Armatimonadota bacterium]